MDRSFELKNLRSLRIQNKHFNRGIVALSNLILPSLTSVVIRFPKWKVSSWYTLMALLPPWDHSSCHFHIPSWNDLIIKFPADDEPPLRSIHFTFDDVDGHAESPDEQPWIVACLRHKAFRSIPFHNISGFSLDVSSSSNVLAPSELLIAFLKNFIPLTVLSTTTPPFSIPVSPSEIINRLENIAPEDRYDYLHLRFGSQDDKLTSQNDRSLTIWGIYVWNDNSRR
ncbi:hypothetical protein SISNIDRAFT_460872, partial [Sistotremastrum niveocremeum HHB9708]